jgi:outer membrane usher protein
MWWRQINVGLVLPLAILAFLISAKAETTETDQVQLQLDVLINGHPLNLIAAFVQMPDGKLASTRSELTELGVAVSGDGAPDEIILLDALPGVSYVYDDSMQSIELELPSTMRLARRLQAGGEGEFIEAQSGTGLVVNYTGYGAANYDIPNGIETFNGASLTLDARGFSKLGTIRQTGIIGTTTFSDFTVLRLDTTLSHSDQNSMLSYRLGDIIVDAARPAGWRPGATQFCAAP